VGELDATAELVGALRRVAASRALAGDLRGAQAIEDAVVPVEHAGKASAAAVAAVACDRLALAYELQLDALDSWQAATQLLVAAMALDGERDEPAEIDLRESDQPSPEGDRRSKRTRRRRRDERGAKAQPALTVDDMISAHVAPGPAVTYDAWVDRLHDQRMVLRQAARSSPILPPRPRPPERGSEFGRPRRD
jgi:hypothetical protein